MKEPSVLDYVKAKLNPWRRTDDFLAAVSSEQAEQTQELAPDQPIEQIERIRLPWRSLSALFLALMAQLALEPPDRSPQLGLGLYAFAGAVLLWSIWKREWSTTDLPDNQIDQNDSWTVRLNELIAGIVLTLIAFLLFKGNRITLFNFSIWIAAIFFLVRAFWVTPANRDGTARRVIHKIVQYIQMRGWSVHFTRWTLVLVVVLATAAFFRFYRLADVPPEMVSDHAEKLLDVFDVLHGQTRIFFPRNTGREAVQMYLTAAVIELFNTGYSFLSLKIGTALAGLLTLPYIYLLGKELGNRRVGLLAILFAGIAYWPNVISRIALRFTLYPFFAAPVLYHMLRGIRTRNRNDFILSGLWLGLGLQGYSTMRIVPFIIVTAVGIYLLHQQSKGHRTQSVLNLLLLSFFSLLTFLPLLRYSLENPEMVSFRALTRLSGLEREIAGSVVQVFFHNLWNSLIMFFWDNGQIWVHSLPGRPALDIVSAALFFLGVILVLSRYVRRLNWQDLFLLLSIPLLMLPSILSLAFPDENPSLNRAGAAMIPVFLIIGIALDGLLFAIKKGTGRNAVIGWVIVGLLFGWSTFQNYQLVFVDYQNQYRASAWNTSEIGSVVRNFAGSVGSPESVWVVAYPHWVDTRLVGINAGYPTWDTAIAVDQINTTVQNPGTKLFIVNPRHTEALDELKYLYPGGVSKLHTSELEGKDFYLYLVSDSRSEIPVETSAGSGVNFPANPTPTPLPGFQTGP